jgi:hypothetical protein
VSGTVWVTGGKGGADLGKARIKSGLSGVSGSTEGYIPVKKMIDLFNNPNPIGFSKIGC